MQDELERRIEPNATVLIAGRGDQGAIPVLLPIIAASPLETDKDSEGVPNSNRPSEIPSPRMNQVRNLCNECPEFRDALSVADEKLSAANTKIQDLCQQIKQLQRHNFSQQKHFEQSSSNYMSEKEAEILFLKEDNSNLRGMIDEMKSANAVVHEDAHYIKLLESLNGTILSSVAKAFKSSCQQDLSEEAGNKILDTLSRIDPWGKQTVEALSLSKVTIWAFHKDAKKRMVLVRHIIALFLWESVFDPFAFGLEKTVSHNLRTIEKDILSSGIFRIDRGFDNRSGFFKGFNVSTGPRSSRSTPTPRENPRICKVEIGRTHRRDHQTTTPTTN
jgi:hypothetical protein